MDAAAVCIGRRGLIDPEFRVTRVVEPRCLGLITDDDLAALATHGLPKGKGWLTPAIGFGPTLFDGADEVIRLSTYISSEHQFVVHLSDGVVRKVSTAFGGYRCHVNTSLARFVVDMAWRYHHIPPVLSEMQHGGNDEVPFVDPDEAPAIKQLAWAWAWSADPPIDVDPCETFWFGAI